MQANEVRGLSPVALSSEHLASSQDVKATGGSGHRDRHQRKASYVKLHLPAGHGQIDGT